MANNKNVLYIDNDFQIAAHSFSHIHFINLDLNFVKTPLPRISKVITTINKLKRNKSILQTAFLSKVFNNYK